MSLTDKQIRMFVIDRTYDLGSLLVRSIFWAFVTYYIYRSIAVLAGQVTVASVWVSFITKASHGGAARWIFTALLAGWGFIERAFRKQNIRRMSARIKNLESQIDPQRTSSGLTPSGDTHPGDVK